MPNNDVIDDDQVIQLGNAGDIPVLGDWNGTRSAIILRRRGTSADECPWHRSAYDKEKDNMAKQAKNTICLWYDGDAEEAARFYASTFPDSSARCTAHREIFRPGRKEMC